MSREKRRASGFGGGACALSALLLLASCTVYKPLDGGSRVPWARNEAPMQARVAAVPKPVLKPTLQPTSATGSKAASLTRADRVRKKTRGIVVMREPTPQPAPTRAVATAGNVHRVAAGEALSRIARRYGVSMQELAAANGIAPPYAIMVDQTLRIPDSEGAKTEAEPRVAEAPGRMVEPAPKRPAPSERYVVQKGDALARIARRFEVPMKSIARANEIAPPYRLEVGQTLTIPRTRTAMADERASAKTAQAAHGDPRALSGKGFLWPVSGNVIGHFGGNDNGQPREGIAIAARKGAPVRAAEDGTVVYAGDAIRGYGRMILVRHADGYVSAYAHNSAILVNVGDTVDRGQVIARVGDTGDVTEAQLHFQLRKGRKPIDPETVLVKDTTELASTE